MDESVYKQLIYRILAILSGVIVSGGLYFVGNSVLATQLIIGILIIGTIPIIIEMIRSVRRGKIGLDVIALTAIVASVVLGELIAGVVILLMLTGGEALEAYAQKRARKELDALLRRAPVKTHRLIGSQVSEISVTHIQPGFHLQIKPGETIPVDGHVLRGRSSLDESSLTGESLQIKIGPKDEILSGAINQDGVIIMVAAKTSQASQYQQIIDLVREAASERSPFVRLADELSLPFTILSFTIAGLAWWFTGQPMRAFEVLVVATPCPLLIATPVAIIAGMSRAARRGIIVKNGGALETMAKLNSLVFDKTGTLTRGEPVVTEVRTFGVSQTQLLGLAASLEQNSTHILATALTMYAKKHHVAQMAVDNVKEIPGRGTVGNVNGSHILVGSHRWLQEHKVTHLEKLKFVRATDILVAPNDD